MSDDRVERVYYRILDIIQSERFLSHEHELRIRFALDELDAEPDHFYLAECGEVDDSQVTDIEPRYRTVYTIIGGPVPSVTDAWEGGWLSDDEWDCAVVLGFKGTRAVAAYHTIGEDDPTGDALDAERAQEALYDRITYPSLDADREPVAANALDEQDAFERAMGGPPEHCIRVGDGYASTEYNAWRAHDYVQQWAGWKARAAIEAMDAEPLEGRDDE